MWFSERGEPSAGVGMDTDKDSQVPRCARMGIDSQVLGWHRDPGPYAHSALWLDEHGEPSAGVGKDTNSSALEWAWIAECWGGMIS